MDKSIVIPTLFSPISQYIVYANSRQLVFEIHDNYQKQTYRNRYYIYGPNGKQLLNVPIIHQRVSQKIKTKDVKIDYSSQWQKSHIKSLDSAYSSSPFYEFYKDDILPIIKKNHKYLLDLNFHTYSVLSELIDLNAKTINTSEYLVNFEGAQNYKYLADAKNDLQVNFKNYIQVFHQKHGFIQNLSILDLLFNEGPNSSYYLEKQLLTE